MGVVLLSMGDKQRARYYFEKSLKALRKHLAPDHPQLRELQEYLYGPKK
jgi:hypothetical protein